VDIATGRRWPTPAGINSVVWESKPTISGGWILFGRQDFAAHRDRVILHNFISGEKRVLAIGYTASRRSAGGFVAPGQVNGNYASFADCDRVRCRFYVHDIAANASVAVLQLALGCDDGDGPVVSRRGTVYVYDTCMDEFIRIPLGGTPTPLGRHETYAGHIYLDDSGATPFLLFADGTDIYRVSVPD
jgi:hypothetical protein